MQTENKKPYIPTTELLSFLNAARIECIDSVILDDFNAKMEILKTQPEFCERLSGFTTKSTMVALRILADLNIVSIYPYGNSREIMLSKPVEQLKIWESKNTVENRNPYFPIVQAYRTMEIDLDKAPKIKRNS